MTTTLIYPGSHQSCYGQNASALYTPSRSYVDGPTDDIVIVQHPATETGTSSTPTHSGFGSVTAGNILIAVIHTGTSGTLSGPPTGWVSLSNGDRASAHVEIFWKRADGTGTETGSLAWTADAGSVSWCVGIIEVAGGCTVGNPTGFTGGSNTTSTTKTVTGATSLDADGATAIITALTLSGTSGGWTADGNPSSAIQQAPSTLDTTSDRFRWSYAEPWKNRDTASDVAGTDYAWTTGRALAYAAIRLNGIGRNAGTDTAASDYAYAGVNGDTGVAAPCYGQAVFAFDTSPLSPVTPSAATLTITTHSSVPTNAGNATLEARKVSAFSALAGDDSFPFYLPADLSGATLLASKNVSNFSSTSTAVDLTSDAGFPGAVELAATTYIVLATNDQRSSTSRATSEIVKFWTENATGTSNDPVLTVVQPSQDISPSSIATAEAFGTAVITTTAAILPSAIASAEAFGTAVITTGPVDVAPSAISSGEAFGTPDVSTPAALAASAGRAREMAVRAVTPDGELLADISDKVHVVSWTEELNGHGEAIFEADPYRLVATDLELDSNHEVQIFYDGQLRFWGPVRWCQVQAGPKLVFHAYGASEWFEHRYFGEALDNSFGDNMSFELVASIGTGDTPWAVHAFFVDPTPTMTATRVTDHVLVGTYAIKLYVAAATGGLQFITQSAETPDIPTINAKAYLTAWYYTTAADYANVTVDKPFPLLHLNAQDSLGNVLEIGEVTATKDTLVDSRWTRVECEVFIPEDAHFIEFRCYGLDPGTIWWDYVRLTTDPFLDETETETADILVDLVDYAQGRTVAALTQAFPTTIKTDLNIDPAISGSGSTVVSREYHLHNRAQVWHEIHSLLQAGLGCDMQMVYDHVAKTRTFRIVCPALGTAKPGLELHVGTNVSADFDGVIDGRKNASAVVVLSGSTGPAQEFGFANDTARFDSTLLESVEPASPDLSVNVLAAEADAELARDAAAQFLPDLVVPASVILHDGLSLGDTVPLRIDEGWIQQDVDVRVVKMAFDPDSDTVRLTVNAADLAGRNQAPNLPQIVGDLRKRVYQLERNRPPQPRTPPAVREVITFVFDPASLGESAPSHSSLGGRAFRVVGKCRDAPGGADATFDIIIDGVSAGTLTIADGDTVGETNALNTFVHPYNSTVVVEPTALNGADGIEVQVYIGGQLGRV